MTIIGTKWVFRNKLDENGIVSQNKARLVAQGYNQQEGIDYDGTYALVDRLESIRILLAYSCALDIKLFQMDVKSAFLNCFINEEVYMAQPPGFIDFEKPDYVYKLKKALYGLKQAPKAWHDRLKAFLIKHEYKMGMGVTDWYQEPRVMSSSTHPIIILSDSNIEDAFSSTNTPDYTPASSDYFPASPGNIFSDPSEDLSKDLLASLTILPFHDDPYMKVMQVYNATTDFDQLETELQEARTQKSGFQREQIRHDDEIVLARIRISTLEILIEDIKIRHRSDMKSLLDTIHELKGGPPTY
ncbi:copia protein [Tanacetum coccineum]